MKVKKEVFSEEEKRILADFVNSEYWPVYRKLLANYRNNVKEVALSATSLSEIDHNRGRVYQIELELADFQRNFTKVDASQREKQLKTKKGQ